MALTFDLWPAAPSDVSSTNQLLAANLIVFKMKSEANDLARKSLSNQTIDDIIKSVSGRAQFLQSSRDSSSEFQATRIPAKRLRRRTIEGSTIHSEQQQHQQQQEDQLESAHDEDDVQMVGRRRAHVPHYYQQMAHQQPTNMYNRQQQHKNLKPVHVSISQQTVNGLLSLLLLFIISICGCIGTITIMSALTVVESLQTRGNCYLVSLALAQLLVNLFVIPSSALQIMAGEGGLNGQALCHYQWLTLEFSLIVSQLSFALIAADNYLGYCCSEKVITSVANFRQQQGHELVAQRGEEQQPHRQCLLLHKGQEKSDYRGPLCHLARVGTAQKVSLQATTTTASEEELELERHKAERKAHISLQRDFLGQSLKATTSGKLCNNQDETTTTVIKRPTAANSINQFFNYSFKRHHETQCERRESSAACPEASSRSKRGIVSLFVSRPSKEICAPQVENYQLKYNTDAGKAKEKPFNATGNLARQFALETPGARLMRPGPFNYRICCGRLRVLLWIVSIWSLAFVYIIHQHERSFTAKFCSITSTHYQPILPTNRRPALYRDSATQTHLFPIPSGDIDQRYSPDDELIPFTSTGRMGTLATGRGKSDDQLLMAVGAHQQRLKRYVDKNEETHQPDSSSVIPSSNEARGGGNSISVPGPLLDHEAHDKPSPKRLNVMTTSGTARSFRQPVAYGTIAHNLTFGLSALLDIDEVAIGSRNQLSNPLGRRPLSQVERANNVHVPVRTTVHANSGQRLLEPVSNYSEKSQADTLFSPESRSQIITNKRQNNLRVAGRREHLDVLLSGARSRELPKSRHNNIRKDFIIQARSMGSAELGRKNGDRNALNGADAARIPGADLETSKGDSGRGSRRGLTRITIIDGSATLSRKPHHGSDKISTELPTGGQIAISQTVEGVPATKPSAPLVWPLLMGVHHFQRQLGTIGRASNLKGTDTKSGSNAPEIKAMLEPGSRSSSIPTSAGLVLSSEVARSEPEDERAFLASVGQAPSKGPHSGRNEVDADYNRRWQVAPLGTRADERDGPLKTAGGLPIISDKMGDQTTWRWHRLSDKAELASQTNKPTERPRRQTRPNYHQIGSIIPVYSQCDGISCHRNSSTGNQRASWGAASAVAMISAWGSQHKVPTNDKWDDKKLVLAVQAQWGPTRELGHDFSSTVHSNNDKQTSRPKSGPKFDDRAQGGASLAPDTKRRALMNNVHLLQFNVEASDPNLRPPMQMAPFRASSRSNEQIRRTRNAYDEVGLIDPHRAGANLGLEAEAAGPSTATDLASKERPSAWGQMNIQLERPAKLHGQSQMPPPIQTKDFFWPMLMGSIVLPSLVSSLLLAGAYFKMKEFKMRPYKPMPVNTVASTPPALLTPRSPIPLIAQRQVYAFDHQPAGSPSKFGSSYLTADQLVGKSAQLNGDPSFGGQASKLLANEYAMLGADDEGVLSDSNSGASNSNDCSSEHDDGELLARAAHATARRVSEATELMKECAANKTINNNNNNSGGANDRIHQDSSSPIGSRRRPAASLRAKSKTMCAADDLTDSRRGVGSHASSHAQLNQVMSAPVNCVSAPSYAARHIDEQAVSPEACYLPSSQALLHATNDLSPLEARQVPGSAPRFCQFQQPNHRAISFSAPPSANGHPQAQFGPADNFSAREFTNYLRECEMAAPLAHSCAYPTDDHTRIGRKRHSSPVPFFKPILEHDGGPLDRHQQHAHSFHSGSSAVMRNPRLVPQATLHEQQPTWPLDSVSSLLGEPFNQSAHTPPIYAGPRPQGLSIQQQQPLADDHHPRSLIERNQSLERHRSLPAKRRLPLREQLQAASSQQRAQHSNLMSRHADLTRVQMSGEQKHAGRQSHSSAAMMSRALANVIRSVDEGDDLGGGDNSKSRQTIEAGEQANQPSAIMQLRPASRAHSRLGPSSGSSGEMNNHRVLSEHQGARLSASDTSNGNTPPQTETKKRVKPPNLSHLIAVGQSHSDAANAVPLHRTRQSVVPLEQRDISATVDANSKVILCTYTYMTDEQLLKSNMIVFVVNLSLWVPFVALLIVLQYSDSISIEFKDSVWWLAVLNCCSCSYLYALTNKDFREAFNKLFYYCCCKSHVTFQKKTPIFRRQLDVDQRGNLRVHIIPALNVYSNKLFAATGAPLSPDLSPTPNAPSRSRGEPRVGGALAASAAIDQISN